MKKVFIISALLILSTGSVLAYQRTKIEPTYFIPQTDIKAQEKIATKKRPLSESIKQEVQNQNKKMEKNPEYQQIYDEYLKDVEQIGQTNTYPNTNQINKDLEEMTSNEHFLVP